MSDDHEKELEAARKVLEEISYRVVGLNNEGIIKTAWNLKPLNMAKELGTHFQIFKSLIEASYSFLPWSVMQIEHTSSTSKQRMRLKAPATL